MAGLYLPGVKPTGALVPGLRDTCYLGCRGGGSTPPENPGSTGQKEMGYPPNRTSQWACPAGSHCPGHLHRACHLSPQGWVLQPVAASPRPSPPPKPLHCSS